MAQVMEAIHDPDIPNPEMPQSDPRAAEELPHKDLSRGEANELLVNVYGDVLDSPAGLYDELNPVKFYSDYVALVEGSDQANGEGESNSQPTLLESSLPLRAEASDGHHEPVDLGLDRDREQIRPANPLVDLSIPMRLEEGISLPESDIRIELSGAPAERAPSIIEEAVASYPNVAEDTAFIVAPTPTGIETFALLQSPDAPTSQTFHLEIPAGAALQATQDGGAEVTQSGETLMTVLPPTAMDATEAPVPVGLEVKGDSLTITANPGDENQFPILVDPMWDTYNWYDKSTTTWAGWSSFSNSPVFTTSQNGWHEGIWDSGLQIASGNTAITPGAQARWDYRVPRWATDYSALGVRPTSFINRVIFSKLFFDVQKSDNGGTLWQDPFLAFYIWDESKGHFVSIGNRYGTEGNLTNMNYEYNLYNTAPPNENVNAKQTSLELVSHQTKSQYRQLYVGLAAVELSDKDLPGFGSLGGPSQWVNTQQLPINYKASDSGLGIHQVRVEQPTIGGGKQSLVTSAACVGSARNPCPRTLETAKEALKYAPASMPQGINNVKVVAQDPLGQESSPGNAQVKVDHTAPVLKLSGTLTEQSKVGTKAAEYTLNYSASDGDKDTAAFAAAIGSAGTTSGKFQRPQGVAVDGSGNIWVVDKNNYRVQKFDKDGKFLLQFGSQGTGAGKFTDPRGIAVSSNGTVWVSDIAAGKVQAFSESGTYIRQLSFNQPYGLATGPSGRLWVSEVGTGRVYRLQEDGSGMSYVYGTPTNPTGSANLPYPVGLATDSTGGVWVADPVNDRVQKFDVNGQFVTQFGVSGTGAGQLDGTLYIAVARSGNLLVTDEFSNRVQVFRPDGTFLRQFGTIGAGSGQFTEVRGIAINNANEAFVADAGNNRVHRWSHADLDKQSGVASTEVKVDGQAVEPVYAPGCSTDTCTINRAWTLKATDFASGSHTVKVTATDGAGIPTSETLTIETINDTTGPQLTTNSAFFTAPEGWLEQQSYFYVAGASDSTYGVTSLVLKVDGKVVHSKAQSCPNGGCGAVLAETINMANYEGGAHPAELVTTDAGGNTTKKEWTINVNPEGLIPTTEAVSTLEAVEETSGEASPALLERVDEQEPSLTTESGDLVAPDSEVFMRINGEGVGDFRLEPAGLEAIEGAEDENALEVVDGPVDPITITPISSGASASDVEAASNSAAIVSNAGAGAVDLVLRPVYDGAFSFQSIRDPGAPTHYSWTVDLNENQYLEQIDSHHVQVFYDGGYPAFTISAIPAHDAVGTVVPTSIVVDGPELVTLRVEHDEPNLGVVYPVVAGAGWEGGFSTHVAAMPPPEAPPNESVPLAVVENVSAPEPVSYSEAGIDEFPAGERSLLWDARASGGPRQRQMVAVQCPLAAVIESGKWTCGNPFKKEPPYGDWNSGIRSTYMINQYVAVWHKGGVKDNVRCARWAFGGINSTLQVNQVECDWRHKKTTPDQRYIAARGDWHVFWIAPAKDEGYYPLVNQLFVSGDRRTLNKNDL